MDYEQADTTLREYEDRVNEYLRLAAPQAVFPVLRMPARRVNDVLQRLTPDHRRVTGKALKDHVAALALVRQAKAIINATREMKTAEGKCGQPVLPMTLLDPVVYDAAIRHWESGHYRIAVNEAATNVDRFTQRRLQRVNSFGTALMQEAFSTNPPQPGKPRLRCPGAQASESVKSQQVGALSYATACFMAMRNPAAHLKGDWNPVTAFHHLVSLSQVAWWVRNWDLESHAPPEPTNG